MRRASRYNATHQQRKKISTAFVPDRFEQIRCFSPLPRHSGWSPPRSDLPPHCATATATARAIEFLMKQQLWVGVRASVCGVLFIFARR